ncbi:hypothetical protein, partial [Morganella morganii]|uniref:hypothetical protein n=1 Tax=Morganella morganii TaxID=582 RepID=UPI0021D04D88
SSAWGQVGPPRYGRQANSFNPKQAFTVNDFCLFTVPKNLSNRLSTQNTFGVVRLSLTVH